MIAMTFPPLLAQVESIVGRERSGARWLMTCAGTPGWCALFAHGLCVALMIERSGYDDGWLIGATLWIASMRGALDDSVLLDGETLWLARRYPTEIEHADLDASLNQQLKIARWLSDQGDNAMRPGHEAASAACRWA